MRFLLQFASYLFHLALALLLLGIAFVSRLSGSNTLKLAMIPWWTDAELRTKIAWISLFGLATIALAAFGRLKWLYALYTGAIFVAIVWGFYLGPYQFQGVDGLRPVNWLTVAALVAFLGAVAGLFKRKKPERLDYR